MFLIFFHTVSVEEKVLGVWKRRYWECGREGTGSVEEERKEGYKIGRNTTGSVIRREGTGSVEEERKEGYKNTTGSVITREQ